MFNLPLLTYIRSGDLIGALAYLAGCMIIIFLILPFHEYAHGFAAYKLGDPTAKHSGRLSLNPISHIDWLGAALIIAVGFGWAKPVPVNARYFNRPKRDMAITAVAGPISNLLMAFVCLLLFYGLHWFSIVVHPLWLMSTPGHTMLSFLTQMLELTAYLNVGLAVFNLIPIPPLDGSRLLTALLPDRIYYRIMQYEQYIMIGLFLLIFVGVLDGPLSLLRTYTLEGLKWFAALPFKLI